MGKLKTQGTDVYVSPDGIAVDKIACVMSFSGLAGPRDQVDVTCFSSQEREYEAGMATPGQVTIGGAYDSADTVFETLVELKESGAVVQWYVGGSDGTAAPTVTSTVLTPPTSRTGISFKGYVADVSWQLEANNVWKFELVIQRSGAWTLTQKTP